jgi:16S rRNA (adenine1518-N6/adenine1519-N6)-dimethyltransferase
MAEFGIVPDRELGQNFLVDDNVLRIVGRLAEPEPGEVVVEVGAGLGVLTDWLAARAGHVHAIEIDRRLEPALRATLSARDNVTLLFADALDVDLSALDPVPSALIGNLPYGVATPVVMEALPVCDRFCVMVQREIADRLFAQPGSPAYGAVSVLVGLTCDRTGRRAVSRRVFAPQPNVDSALVAFHRRPGFPPAERWEWVRRVVHGAFAHRRKTLANSLALSGLPAPPREIAAMRAEQLPPARFAQLAEELAA